MVTFVGYFGPVAGWRSHSWSANYRYEGSLQENQIAYLRCWQTSSLNLLGVSGRLLRARNKKVGAERKGCLFCPWWDVMWSGYNHMQGVSKRK